MYYQNISDGFIVSVSTGTGNEKISEARYIEILRKIRQKPPRTETTDYRLKTDLNWEAYELPSMPDPQQDDLNADELPSILLGGDGV